MLALSGLQKYPTGSGLSSAETFEPKLKAKIRTVPRIMRFMAIPGYSLTKLHEDKNEVCIKKRVELSPDPLVSLFPVLGTMPPLF